MITRSLALSFSLAVVTACGGGADKTADKKSATVEPPKNAVEKKVDEMTAFLNDNSKPLTPELYEKLLLSLEACSVDDNGIDHKCEAWKTFDKARNRNTAVKDFLGASSSIGQKHIGHASPAVRLQSARLMSSMFGSNAATQEIIVAAAEKEQEPSVLKAMINVVGSRHKGNEKVTALLMKGADHANEKVRIESMSWFLTSFGEGVKGTFDKVLEHLDKDPSEKVRAFLCGRLFGSNDTRALAQLDKYISAKDTPKELFQGCWDGAIAAWAGFPLAHNPQQKAFDLTLKVLNSKPRTQDRPPWMGMMSIRSAKSEFKADDKFGNEWLAKVKGWYKKDKLLAALEGVATDGQANWMARTGSLDVMQEIGAPKATFEKLAKKYAAATTGDDSHIKRKVDDILKKM